jgi:uncharacterized protein YjbI with pentapeptide repeats
VNLMKADLSGTDFTGADLTNANLSGATVISAIFKSVKGRDTIKGLASVEGADQAVGL